MIVVDLEHGKEYELMREMLNNIDVQDWLFGGTNEDLFKLPVDARNILPFDFMKVDPGPQATIRETLYFRKSLKVLSHHIGNVAFANVLKFENSRMLNDRLIFAVDEVRMTSVCLIAVRCEDGGVMLRASFSTRTLAFNKVTVLVTYASSGSTCFHIQQRFTIDRDCSFCMVRAEPCDCDGSLKERCRFVQQTLSDELGTAWNVGSAFIRSLRGPAWVVFPDGSKIRAHTSSTSDVVTPRVQHIISLLDSWKRLLFKESDDRSSSSVPSLELVPRADSDSVVTLYKSRKPKRFECDVCGSSFRSSSHLKRHKAGVHLREKTHICEFCGSKFGQRSHLLVHVNNVHGKCEKLECTYCGAKFGWRTNYLRHIRRQHADAGVPVE
ncbi:hypothetical protein NDN08_005161 [Rhodosorus marinus]|uniref:C2H2-type domain-containing protein n=1 Tax=Rhodosorus marinus TaxID=101924 RepID=A0AAV8V449_9RHOD|nr:hypothetical protein NDN08_005161 [Rhodosorus marinus]